MWYSLPWCMWSMFYIHNTHIVCTCLFPLCALSALRSTFSLSVVTHGTPQTANNFSLTAIEANKAFILCEVTMSLWGNCSLMYIFPLQESKKHWVRSEYKAAGVFVCYILYGVSPGSCTCYAQTPECTNNLWSCAQQNGSPGNYMYKCNIKLQWLVTYVKIFVCNVYEALKMVIQPAST